MNPEFYNRDYALVILAELNRRGQMYLGTVPFDPKRRSRNKIAKLSRKKNR